MLRRAQVVTPTPSTAARRRARRAAWDFEESRAARRAWVRARRGSRGRAGSSKPKRTPGWPTYICQRRATSTSTTPTPSTPRRGHHATDVVRWDKAGELVICRRRPRCRHARSGHLDQPLRTTRQQGASTAPTKLPDEPLAPFVSTCAPVPVLRVPAGVTRRAGRIGQTGAPPASRSRSAPTSFEVASGLETTLSVRYQHPRRAAADADRTAAMHVIIGDATCPRSRTLPQVGMTSALWCWR